MKIIVTGHKGFIGSYLYNELKADATNTVVGIDYAGCAPNSEQDIRMQEWNQPPYHWADKVYHLAAFTDARGDSSYEMTHTNVLAAVRIFEKFKDKVVFASSCAVHYNTPYGVSKDAAEKFAALNNCGIVRLCNIFGHGGHSVVDVFRRSTVLRIAGDGQQLRTYAPVKDAVDAFLACKPGDLKVVTGTNYTVNQIADMYPHKERTTYTPSKWDIPIGVQLTGTMATTGF